MCRHPHFMCRWAGYKAPIVQGVPCYPTGLSLPAECASTSSTPPLLDKLPRLPLGYLQEDDGAAGVRTCWTPDDTRTPVSTWVTDCRLKFSDREIMARGQAGEEISAEVRLAMHPD